MWLAFGDTAEATRELDDFLRTIPALDPAFLADVSDVALVVRSLALRADLAETHGDRATAHESARAVVSLWSGADSSLSDVMARMNRVVDTARQR
jgi:hypothetical protein